MSARTLSMLCALLFVGLALVATSTRTAHAQVAAPAPVDAKIDPTPSKPLPRSATPAGKTVSKRDSVSSPAKGAPNNAAAKRTKVGMAFAFWGFAALTILGSIFVITRRNLIAAVMGMVGTFFALAALYMMLYAHFLAIIQMLVYAGAIMVLFVFVIMILNKPEDEPYALTGRVGKVLAGLAMAYLVFRIGSVLVDVPSVIDDAKNLAPAKTADGDDWGSTAAVGMNLFNDYLFPFEAVSILLLIAVVGAIAIARPLKDDDDASDDAAPAPAAGGH